MRRLLELVATLRRSKHARYCVVSVNGVIVTQVLLVLFVHGFGWSAVTANLVAVSMSCFPSFLLNKHWVWGHTGWRNVGSQMAAFWAMALVGLALSTLVVGWLDSAWDSPIVANVGNILGFGALWVAKFFVLDRLMFRHQPAPAPEPVPVTAP